MDGSGPRLIMISWAPPSLQSKRHLDLDRFSRFCTDYRSVPILYNGPPLPLKIVLPYGDVDPI